MSPAVWREFTMTVQLYQHLESLDKDDPRPVWGETKVDNIFLRPLFNANATINMAYEQFKETTDVASLPAHEFIRRMPDIQASEASRSPLLYIYNPVGKILFAIGQPDFSPYIGRVHNLDGLLRLVGLQLEVKVRGVKDEDVPAFVQAMSGDYYNPYRRELMQWDPQKRTLSLKGHGRKRRTTEVMKVNI